MPFVRIGPPPIPAPIPVTPCDNTALMSLDELQTQLRGALDQQIETLKRYYESAVAEARRQAIAEAEKDLAARMAQVRSEWDARLQGLVAAARAESYQQAVEAAAIERDERERQLRDH